MEHILERERELAELTRCLEAAAAGSGEGIAVAGEAGAGKSALVETACLEAAGMRVLRGMCDPLATPRPLGPFRDLARQTDFAALHDPDLSLASVCDLVFDGLVSEPTVLVVEDLHWADLASVEVLRFLARRIEAMPLAVFVTYRSTEIGAQHPCRALLGDFAILERLSSVQLGPLSVDGVRSLLTGTSLDADEVHALTGGNPFFVTEVAKDRGRSLPTTVRDAVLARTAGMAPEDFEVLQLVATAPDRLDERLLPALGVDLPTLGRLDGTGLLVRSRSGLAFSHELARQAVESTIPVGGAAQLHRRLLDALETTDPTDYPVLTHHAAAAGDSPRAARYAQSAAGAAATAGAHTEAVAFLQTALAHVSPAEVGQRAALMLRLGFEQYVTNHLDDAIANVDASLPLWSQLGDAAGLSAAHDTIARLQYYNTHRAEAEKHAERAERAAVADSASAVEYASARATTGFLAFQRSEFALAATCLQDASRVAQEAEDQDMVLRSQIIRDFTDLALGHDGAREQLVDDVQEALARGLDELASTGYSNLSNLDAEQRRLADAQVVLDRALSHSTRRGIPICSQWQTGVRARVHMLQGRWQASLEDAAHVLRHPGMPFAMLWPHVVEGLVGLRRNGSDGGHLDEAWQLAENLDEPTRRLPVLSALAERAWLTGAMDERVSVTAPQLLGEYAETPAAAWGRGELALWLRRLGMLPDHPAGLATPYHLAIEGRHAEAAAWWRQCGATYDEALALADSDDTGDGLRAVEQLDHLGAGAAADRVRQVMRERGVVNVPQRPRASTLANPSGLTNRQLDVAKLVARGLTNAEVAQRLYISPKTADHHVSAVLTKLGLANRREVISQAQLLGL